VGVLDGRSVGFLWAADEHHRRGKHSEEGGAREAKVVLSKERVEVGLVGLRGPRPGRNREVPC